MDLSSDLVGSCGGQWIEGAMPGGGRDEQHVVRWRLRLGADGCAHFLEQGVRGGKFDDAIDTERGGRKSGVSPPGDQGEETDDYAACFAAMA